jgi:hypothetical protein
MATEALNVIAATQLANRIDFVFIMSWGFYLIIPRSMAKASIFVDEKRRKGDYDAASNRLKCQKVEIRESRIVNRESSDWGERHGRKSREAAVREMGIDRIQSRFGDCALFANCLRRWPGEGAFRCLT